MTRRRHRIVCLAAIAVAVALCTLAACGKTASSGSGTARAGGSSDTAGDERAAGSFTSTAVVVTYGEDGLLFVDQENGTPYVPGLDNAVIEDGAGRAIAAGDLVRGNIVEVTGNGIMLESYPGKYPGITRVAVVDEGAPEDADRYDDIVAGIWQPRDAQEPPSASISYTTELAQVSMALDRFGYTWSWDENGERQSVAVDAAHPAQVGADGLIDAVVGDAVEARLSFDVPATGITVTRWSEGDLASEAERAGSASAVDAAALPGEEVACTLDDAGNMAFTIEPGWRYQVLATFDAGEATFAFTVRAPKS